MKVTDETEGWMARLLEEAPQVDLLTLRLIARLLAGGADTHALLVVTDALIEGAGDLVMLGRSGPGAGLLRLAAVLSAEAERRREGRAAA